MHRKEVIAFISKSTFPVFALVCSQAKNIFSWHAQVVSESAGIFMVQGDEQNRILNVARIYHVKPCLPIIYRCYFTIRKRAALYIGRPAR